MEHFKNCMLEFLKQQEKQWQENLKQEKQPQEDKKKDSGSYSNVLQKKTTREI